MNGFEKKEEVWIAQNGIVAGKLIMHDVTPDMWQWMSSNTQASALLEGRTPGELPYFLRNLQPEGWLADALKWTGNHKQYVQEAIRLLSNISICKDPECLTSIPKDVLTIGLADHTDRNKIYTGYYEGPRARLANHFQERVGHHWQSATMPRFSGGEIKLPMNLSEMNGEAVLVAADNSAFTHIAKFGASGPLGETMPIAEWMGLQLSNACGLNTENFALASINGGTAWALIVERFDIPTAGDENHVTYMINDFCSTMRMDATPLKKFHTPIEDAARALLEVSTNPIEDSRAFFKRVIFANFMRDTDMHMKNISMLKKMNTLTGEIEVRFSPTYDAVPRSIYPDEERRVNIDTGETKLKLVHAREMALPINGKVNNFKEEDFIALAQVLNIPEDEASEIVTNIAQNCTEKAIEILRNLPEQIAGDKKTVFALTMAVTAIVEEAERYLGEDYSALFGYDERCYTIAALDGFSVISKNERAPITDVAEGVQP